MGHDLYQLGYAPQPIDVLRHCADRAGERALLVFPTHRMADGEMGLVCASPDLALGDPRWKGSQIEWGRLLIRFPNGSEARFVGADAPLAGVATTLLWLHADVDDSASALVRIVMAEGGVGDRGQPKPVPAMGQVWVRARSPVVVEGVRFNGMVDWTCCTCTPGDELRNDPTWRCIGIETPHGRVMVGEQRRESDGFVWTVERVCGPTSDGHLVFLTGADMANGTFAARLVAQWPLVTEHASPHGSTFEAAAQLSRRTGIPYDQAIREVEGRSAKAYNDLFKDCERSISMALLGRTVSVDSPPMRTRTAPVMGLNWDFDKAWEREANERIQRATKRERWKSLGSLAGAVAAIVQHPLWRRREIDRVLAEDGRRTPAFATARKAAVMAMYEGARPGRDDDMLRAESVQSMLERLHWYEESRGGGRDASRARKHAIRDDVLRAYERARGLP